MKTYFYLVTLLAQSALAHYALTPEGAITYKGTPTGYSLTQPRISGASFEFATEPDGFSLTLTAIHPGEALTIEGFTLTTADPDAAFIWTRMKPMTDSPDHTGTLAQSAPFTEACNYAAIWTPRHAAILLTNALEERARTVVSRTSESTLTLSPPSFTLTPGAPLPALRIILTPPDEAGRCDWQTICTKARRYLPQPSGSEKTRETINSQIAINFANLTQNPFLRVLDNIKKAALATDFLPQEILLKGYQGGGHDSSHPDYTDPNPQAGGLRDLTLLIDRAAEWGATIGLHINCTEGYPESRYYGSEIFTEKNAWRWLDQSKKIDKQKDLATGALFARLDALFATLPGIRFIYVDAYQDTGFPPYAIAQELAAQKLRIWTEFDTAMDPFTVASHGRSRIKGRMVRFLWNHARDIFRNDPLFPAAHHDGFMSWENERDFNRFIRRTFTQNLPAKYLQHFDLLRWSDQSLTFSDALTIEKQPDGHIHARQNGTLIYRTTPKGQTDIALPWPPNAPTTLYLRHETAPIPPTLPAQFQNKARFLYQLTPLGPVELPLDTALAPNTPYALTIHPRQSIAPRWGEGTLIRDPGFDSMTFTHWKKSQSDPTTIENDPHGNSILNLRGSVSQSITLPPGTWAASAWVSTTNAVTLTLGDAANSTCGGITNYNASACGGDNRNRTTFQRLRTAITLEKETTLPLALSGHGLVDDLRITSATPTPPGMIYYEDFESADQGWGPFVYAKPGSIFTHLSQRNPVNPHFTPDVINGTRSLKTWREAPGPIYRTTEGLLPLPPNATLRLTLETLAETEGYTLTHRQRNGTLISALKIPQGRHTPVYSLTTPNETGSYLQLEKEKKEAGMLVIDDLRLQRIAP